jgi:hypothetical protein
MKLQTGAEVESRWARGGLRRRARHAPKRDACTGRCSCFGTELAHVERSRERFHIVHSQSQETSVERIRVSSDVEREFVRRYAVRGLNPDVRNAIEIQLQVPRLRIESNGDVDPLVLRELRVAHKLFHGGNLSRRYHNLELPGQRSDEDCGRRTSAHGALRDERTPSLRDGFLRVVATQDPESVREGLRRKRRRAGHKEEVLLEKSRRTVAIPRRAGKNLSFRVVLMARLVMWP